MDKSIEILARIEKLENILNGMASEAVVIDNIRNIAIPDEDVSTVTTRSQAISGGPENITVPNNPDQYLRVYYRGKIFNIPAYLIT